MICRLYYFFSDTFISESLLNTQSKIIIPSGIVEVSCLGYWYMQKYMRALKMWGQRIPSDGREFRCLVKDHVTAADTLWHHDSVENLLDIYQRSSVGHSSDSQAFHFHASWSALWEEGWNVFHFGLLLFIDNRGRTWPVSQWEEVDNKKITWSFSSSPFGSNLKYPCRQLRRFPFSLWCSM